MSDVITELAKEASDKAMEIARLKAENAKLRESVKRLMTQRDERLARAEADNAKLRELLADTLMQPRDYCKKYGIEYESWDSANAHLDARMRDLGVEVDR